MAHFSRRFCEFFFTNSRRYSYLSQNENKKIGIGAVFYKKLFNVHKEIKLFGKFQDKPAQQSDYETDF